MSLDSNAPVRGTPEQLHLAAKEERRFLSILLKDKQCLMETVAFGIQPGREGHFTDTKTRFLYDQIHEHYTEHQALLTRTAIETRLGKKNLSDEQESAGMSLWSEVWSNTEASVEDFTLLRDSINNRFVQWQALSIMRERFDELQNAKTNQTDLVKAIRDEMMTLEGVDEDSYSISMSAEEGYREAIAYVKEQRDNPKVNQGVFCGIKAIDDIFNGFSPGTYTVISGMVNGGKTTMMFNMANNMAKAGNHVVYVSIEKKAKLLWRRLLCLNSLCDYNRIKRGGKGEHGITEYWFEKLLETEAELQAMKQNFNCLQFLPETKLPAILAKVERERMIRPIDVLFVDYLGAIGWDVTYQGRVDMNIAAVHKQLMAYGKRHNLVLITASQLKNESTKEVRKKAKKAMSEGDIQSVSVNTEDYGYSQSIAADADNAISLIMPEEFPPTNILVHVTKARDDQAHKTMALLFDGAIGRIYDPNMEPSEYTAIEEMVYDEGVTEAQLTSDNNLFSELDKEQVEKSEAPVEDKPVVEPPVVEVEKVLEESEVVEDKDDLLSALTEKLSPERPGVPSAEVDDDDDEGWEMGIEL